LVCVGLSAAAGIRREAGNCVKEPCVRVLH
jgi:hypothetical protein